MDVAGRPQASYESATRTKAGRIASREPGAKSDLRYYEKLTGLLEQALRRVESLPSEAQDAIASQIIETLDDEEAWALAASGKTPRCSDPWRVKPGRSIVEARLARWTN